MIVAYLAHDVGDAAVRRRIRLLEDGGAAVCLIGFRRGASPGPFPIPGAVEIGRTADGRLGRRVLSVLRAALASRAWRHHLRTADVVLARSLEMLAVAVIARARSGAATPIVYECLDVHRLLCGRSLPARLLRRLERRLLRSAALLAVSSPRFLSDHFEPRYGRGVPHAILLENKVLSAELPPADAPVPPHLPPRPPWRIGWYGVIRCRRSLELLSRLVRGSNGSIEVVIRGRPARDAVPEFDAVVSATPGMSFGGGYDRATDLPALYAAVHFCWAIDFFEDGLNSSWLLPNRLYEGSAFGAVPLACAAVETGRWLARHDCGVRLDVPIEDALRRYFVTLTPTAYRDERARIAALPRDALVDTPASAVALAATLHRLPAVPNRRNAS